MDEDGTGVLTREQFCDMLAGVGIYLTAHEQERVKERCVSYVLNFSRRRVGVATISPQQEFPEMGRCFRRESQYYVALLGNHSLQP